MKKLYIILCLAITFVCAEEKSLFWLSLDNNVSTVTKSALSGKNQKEILQTKSANKITIDELDGTIYWIDNKRKTLKKSNANRSEIVEIAKLDNNARSLVVDGKNRNLYWVNDGRVLTEVIKADLQGQNQTSILKGKNVQCVTIDIESEQIFWMTDNNIAQRIRVSDLDGKITKTILRKSQGPYTDLAIDSKRKELYWIKSEDQVNTVICRCDFSGRNQQEIIASSFITSIDIANDKVLWVGRDAGGNAIFQADRDGLNIEVLVLSNAKIQNIIVK
ncbi:hypothetical protein [Candidatus Uabimicrobium sp. HlEnr_7]|uniref:hypothetical protein n=1 Tax=Candidatus Uabimicrobium helgolandensis TaxID=3095367 RepID=UPI003556F78E